MTYPYPQQDPYQQGGGYYPQTGGFPQPGGGYPPPPPPKSNTTLIVSIVAVVVLALGALGITGFVAPGFFLASDKKDSQSGNGDTATGPEALAQAIVNGLNKKDQAALGALRCPDAEEDVGDVIAHVSDVQSAQLAGPVQQQDDTHASANVAVVTQQGPLTAAGEMVRQGEKWCWHAVSMGGNLPGGPSTGPSGPPSIPNAPPPADPSAPSTPGGGSSDLNALMQEFLTAINSGDVSGAQSKMCADGATSSAQDAVDKDVNLTLDSPPETTGTFVIGDVSGTNGDGSSTIGSLDAEREDDTSPWCIEELRLY